MRDWMKIAGFVVLAALALFLLAAPDLVNTFYLRVLGEALVFAVLAMSIDILAGYTGLSTLGQAGIFGVGAYVVAYMTVRMDQPVYLAFPTGVLGGLLTSAVFGAVAVRTSGIYFLMITLAEGMIVWGIAFRWTSVTGAENGIRGVSRPAALDAYWKYYYVLLFSFVLLSALMYRIVNSPFGLTLKGIREGEDRMRSLGYNVTLHKFLGFLVSGFFAGIAGAFYAFHNNFVGPTAVEFAQSAEGLLMTILGGVGTLFGPALGSAVIVFIRNQISLYTDRWPMVMGAIFVATILLAPDGLVGGTRRLLNRVLRDRQESGLPAVEQRETAGRKEVSAPADVLRGEGGSKSAPTE